MDYFHHNEPVKVVITRDWITACNISQSELGIQNPLIITSKGNLSRLKLDNKFKHESLYSNTVPNPTFESCSELINFSLGKNFDGVIAIGGGSVMDASKSVMAAMGTDIDDIEELIKLKHLFNPHVPAIFIPTTHGTGSEVTMWGTIWDFQEGKKHSLSHPILYPDVAILDGNLTLSLSLDISLTTVLDSLSHCLESIWNKGKNSKSTEYAIRAINLIFDNIEELKANPLELSIRENFLNASNLAGLAFSKTKTAAAHSISYPLTIHFNIPHGIASSITLPALLRINESLILEELSTIYNDLRISGIDEFIELIYGIPEDHLKFKLSDWGVKPGHTETLVSQCFTKGRMDNNIVDLDERQVRSILESCL